jgi:hypothetical protein
MYQRVNHPGAERHRDLVRALIRRSDGLKRRAEASAADHVRRAQSSRAANIGQGRALAALDELIAVTQKMGDALVYLHHTIVRVAEEEPQGTRWQRWRVRRMLKRGVRRMERGVAALENRR